MMNINKRGASHADWAISLGIFLVYILSMLMIIQPGAQPIYKEDRLLKIAKDNYKADTDYRFYKTPLIIDTTDKDFAGAGAYTVRIEGDLPFSGDGNDFGVAAEDADGNLVPLDNFEIVLSETADDRIIFINNVESGRNAFYVISNAKAAGEPDTYERIAVPPTDSYISDARNNFTLIFGSTEVLIGVDEAQLAGGAVVCSTPEDYADMKEAWAYPAGKDFATFYADGSSPRYSALIDVCNMAEPYEQASVFVEEWAARVFGTADGKYGNTQPIRMVVRVW